MCGAALGTSLLPVPPPVTDDQRSPLWSRCDVTWADRSPGAGPAISKPGDSPVRIAWVRPPCTAGEAAGTPGQSSGATRRRREACAPPGTNGLDPLFRVAAYLALSASRITCRALRFDPHNRVKPWLAMQKASPASRTQHQPGVLNPSRQAGTNLQPRRSLRCRETSPPPAWLRGPAMAEKIRAGSEIAGCAAGVFSGRWQAVLPPHGPLLG